MEYQSILNRIEEQKKDRNLSAKIFRYTGLIKAIEFFSQKLNFEQIIDAAFDFTNELLTLQKSAIFTKQDNIYAFKRVKGYENEAINIKNSRELENLAKLHGNLLYDEDKLLKYFNKTIIDNYNVTMVIPLIIEDSLYGFIFISCKALGELDSDDYIIAEALMKLFNNALENCKRYEEVQSMNKELDEKIFNLFAIHHSSKALLSELNMDSLYKMSVDVFSELTQSSVTGFVLYDEKSERYILKAYKDIFNPYNGVEISLTVNKASKIDLNRLILNVSSAKDVAYFNSIFNEGNEALKTLKSRYIVLLLKNNEVLGFVSLGSTTTNTEYKKSIFELTESLASSAYIALSNARLFKRVNKQKKIIEDKLEKIISLNKLTKNINSSLSNTILMELTLKTLEISFGVEKALIAAYDKGKNYFNIKGMLNIESKKDAIKINSSWKRVMEGDLVFEAEEKGVCKYISKSFLKDIGEISGVLIIPIFLDKLEIEMLGVIIIFKFKDALISNEENMLIMETIAGHIAPVMNGLTLLEEQKKYMQPNYIETFKKDLKCEISDAENYMLHLEVIYVENKKSSLVFEENTLVEKLKGSFKKVYPFTGDKIFIIVNEEQDNVEKIKKFKGLDIDVKVLTMGRDFNSFEDFLRFFSCSI